MGFAGQSYGDWLDEAIDKEMTKYHKSYHLNSHPVYSPDGKYAAFMACLMTYSNFVYLMDIKDNQSIKVLNNQDIKAFTFSKDGKKILFLKSYGKSTNEYFCEFVIIDLPKKNQ